MEIKRYVTRLYLNLGRLIRIDIIGVLLKSSDIERKYSQQLQDGIHKALNEIPESIAGKNIKILLENALYSKEYITEEKD